jgi:hypothetical protein
MKRMVLIGAAIVAALTGGVLTTIALADARSDVVPLPRSMTEGLAVSQALASQGVLWHGNDFGAGERVLLVVGGAFPTREEAEKANATIGIGDVHGYYVASIDQFEGLREELGREDAEFVLVSAFRTMRGAAGFMAVALANDAPALLTPRLFNRGYEYVGLGQEQHPDGSGPLIGPLSGESTP